MTPLYGPASDRACKAAVFLSVVVLHLALNLQFDGPVYLQDEMGYLANAAFFTGSSADAASSYHAGYSLFLIPAFAVFTDTWWLWKAIVTTNALLFGFAFLLAYRISTTLTPDISGPRRVRSLLICALYPAYLTGSGYAFSLPGHLLAFMFAVWCLLRSSEARSILWMLSHSVACGFAFWMHPTGAAPVIASIVTLGLRSWKESEWTSLLIGTASVLTLVFAYRYLVQPRIIAAMTPAGFSPALHYPSATDALSLFTSVSSAGEILVRSAGVLAYLTIASMGFAFWGALSAGRRCVALITSPASDPAGYVALFCLMSMAGTIVMGASTFTSGFTPIIDTFFYARYAEAIVLPLLLFGVFLRKLDRYFLAAMFILLTIALLRSNPEFMASPQTGRWRDINFINATGLWPLAFSLVLPAPITVLTMFAVGALAVAIVGRVRNVPAYASLMVAFTVSGALALHFHKSLYSFWGTPGSLPAVVQSLWPPKSCVGVDPAEGYDQSYRLSLLRYYLHNFD